MKTTTPSYIQLSTDSDGQMAFGHIDEAKTIENICGHLIQHFPKDSHLAFIRCTYGDRTFDNIQTVDSRGTPTIGNLSADKTFRVDALITQDPDVVLALPVADCIAVVLYDPSTQTTALAHLGWQASADDLLEKLVAKMHSEFDVDPVDIVAYLSPHIRKDSYFFKPPLAQQAIPSWKPFLHEDSEGSIHIDLTGFNTNALKKAGLDPAKIITAPENTASQNSVYGSHFMHNKNGLDGSTNRFLVSCQLPRNV